MRPPSVLPIAVAVAALLAPACGTAKPPAVAAKPVPVDVAACSRRDLERSIRVTGTLYANEQTVLAARVAGRVDAVRADLGDRVAPGAPVVDLDPTDLRLDLAAREAALAEALARIGAAAPPDDAFDPTTVPTVVRARAEADNAKAKLARAERLQQQDPPVISPQDFADAETAARAAEAAVLTAIQSARADAAAARARAVELAIARQRVAYAAIVAPAAGSGRFAVTHWAVAERMVAPGDFAKEAQPVARLVDDHLIKLRADVPERAAATVRVGQRTTVALADGGNVVGEVGRVAPAVDPATRTLRIEAWLPNDDARLKPGAFAEAEITTGAQAGVVLVPHDAIVSFAGVTKVFAIGTDGVAHAIAVRLGDAHGGLIEVEGYDGALPVAVSGTSRLADGLAVEPHPIAPEPPDAKP